MDLGADNQIPQQQPEASHKRVSFASDIPPDTPTGSQKNMEITPPKLDGVIGKLEIYQSGAIKMRLGNILYDVSLYIFLHEWR
jgi:DNA-directed RNA polymerase III subunit RPC4